MGPYRRRGYIPDLMDAVTRASWGVPKEFLGSALGCVGPLLRGPGAFPKNYTVPLSSLWGPMGKEDTFQISWMPLHGLAGVCSKSPWAVPKGVWAHWLGAPGRSH